MVPPEELDANPETLEDVWRLSRRPGPSWAANGRAVESNRWAGMAHRWQHVTISLRSCSDSLGRTSNPHGAGRETGITMPACGDSVSQRRLSFLVSSNSCPDFPPGGVDEEVEHRRPFRRGGANAPGGSATKRIIRSAVHPLADSILREQNPDYLPPSTAFRSRSRLKRTPPPAPEHTCAL